MKQILCFGDSNSWGYDGESGERLPFKVRWTGRLQKAYEGKDLLKDLQEKYGDKIEL